MYEMKSDIKSDSSGSENKFLMQVPSGWLPHSIKWLPEIFPFP